jgi:hypothetical protein
MSERRKGRDNNDQLSVSKRFSPGASAPLYDSGIRGILGKDNDEGEAFYTFLSDRLMY